MKHTLPLLVATALLTPYLALRADINVNDSVATGSFGKPNDESITKWPEEVQFSATLHPDAEAQYAGTILRNMKSTVVDRNGIEWPAHSRVVAQTFHIPEDSSDQTLEKIFVLYQAVIPANASIKLLARLVDLGESPSLEEYEAGKNLFPEGSSFEIGTACDAKSAQIAEFTFTGPHRVTLKKGHSYAFEIVLDEESNPGASFTWLRSVGLDPNFAESAFTVPLSDSSTSADQRIAIKSRQAFIGIKTSPVK